MIADAQRRVSENARAGARFRRASEGVVGRGRALGGEVAVEVDASGTLVRCAFGRGVQRVSLSRLGAGVVEAYTAARADALAGVRGAAVEAFGADNPILAPLMGGGDGE